MSYPANTTLKRTKPLGKEGNPHPFDTLRVVGPSPVRAEPSVAEWQGGTGDVFIVEPTSAFGTNEVVTHSVLANDYEVVSYGDEDEGGQRIVIEPPKERLVTRETPEQAFIRAAKEAEKGATEKPKNARQRTAIGNESPGA